MFQKVQLNPGMRFIILQGPWLPGALPLHGLHRQGLLQEGGNDQAFQGISATLLNYHHKSSV